MKSGRGLFCRGPLLRRGGLCSASELWDGVRWTPAPAGRLWYDRPGNLGWGKTPALAGLTLFRFSALCPGQEDPRVCGADSRFIGSTLPVQGRPPFLRGAYVEGREGDDIPGDGATPAPVRHTWPCVRGPLVRWGYPPRIHKGRFGSKAVTPLRQISPG